MPDLTNKDCPPYHQMAKDKEIELHDEWRTDGVRDDFTVEGFVVETYIGIPSFVQHPGQSFIQYQNGKRYLQFTVCNGGTDTCVRLPFESVLLMYEAIVNPGAIDPESYTPAPADQPATGDMGF